MEFLETNKIYVFVFHYLYSTLPRSTSMWMTDFYELKYLEIILRTSSREHTQTLTFRPYVFLCTFVEKMLMEEIGTICLI